MLLPLLAVLFSGPVSLRASAPANTAPPPYFPVERDARWVLRNAQTKTPIVWTVKEVSGDTFDISFENPWLNSTLYFRRKGAAVVLQALGIHGLRAPMPTDTVYFDFNAAVGQTWANQIGTIKVVDRDRTVAGFAHCITFAETNRQGQKNSWTFAPAVGLVQFGEGSGAFQLVTGESRLPVASMPGSARAMAAAPLPPVAETRASAGWGFPHVALANNPAANEWLTPISVNRRFQQAVDAGVNFVYLSPKWNELEPSPGRYRFDDLDFQVKQADKANLPLVLHVRVIDTNRSTVPDDLQGKAFDDAAVRARLLRLLDALAPHLHNRVAYCLFGNEIDAYFETHGSEVQAYATLFREARARAQQRFAGAPTSATVTFDGIAKAGGELKPILQYGDFFSVTYYPLHADFTVRDPATVVPDLQRLMRAAGNQRILLQEVGYPTSALNNSSEDKQADMVGRTLVAVAAARDRFIGLNFLFMCDFSQKVTDDLAQGFAVPNAQRFKAYLQTLGMFDGSGNPKKSWAVFQQKARLVGRP